MSSSDPSWEAAVPISRGEAMEVEVSELTAQLEQNTAALTRLTEALELRSLARKQAPQAGRGAEMNSLPGPRSSEDGAQGPTGRHSRKS